MSEKIIAKKTISFGKIDYAGTGRKSYPAEVVIELRQCGGKETYRMENGERKYTGEKTPEYMEISICGEVWNTKKTDVVMAGQCLDHMAKYIKTPLFKRIHRLWKEWHLNGMHAGTPKQERALQEWKAQGNNYEYAAACEYLKSIGLYEVPFQGLTIGKRYNGEFYKYGHGWVIKELPADVLAEVHSIMSEA